MSDLKEENDLPLIVVREERWTSTMARDFINGGFYIVYLKDYGPGEKYFGMPYQGDTND